MKKKIVIALGGNALGNNLKEQFAAVKSTSKAIIDLVQEGHEVVVAHGNGPQVGMINLALEAASKSEVHTPEIPMSVCVALSQGYVGYDLQNALREEMMDRGMNVPVATIITQTIVDENDPAFQNPTKPIGSFYTKEEAVGMEKKGYVMKEDAGRGYRRMVASPMPVDIVEKDVIATVAGSGQLVIAVGGGGIPVVRKGNALKGVSAVVDKDFASCVLAKLIGADALIILTAVEKVAINFGKPDQEWLSTLSVADAKKYAAEGQFAPGSMLPKVEAAVDFAESKEGRESLITLLEKAKDGIAGKTGTRIVQ